MARVLRLVPDVDYKKLPLNPVEGSVFLKVDGKATDQEIAKATGFHIETVQQALDRLVELGAATAVDRAKDQAERVVKAAATLALGGNLGKSAHYDAAALAEDVELELDRRKVILDAAQRIEKLNFYELLGLHRLVDKKEVKAAYYAVAPDFHPDKFFKRKLGSYKPKVEAIFARLTLAHDTLSSAQRRAEYDEYLSTLEQGRRAEGLMEASQEAIRVAQAQIEAEAKRTAEAAEQAQKDKDLADRKRALAAKLGGGRAPQKQEKAPAVPQMDPRQAAEALRVRYEYAKEQAARAQLESSLAKGRMAMVQGDWAGAANLFRIAATLAPSNPDVQRETNEVLSQAAIHLADTFHKLGEFELQQERWSEAAANLLKACAGRPEDARLHERAAFATFKEGLNPKRAAELARRAVELSPKTPQFRVTLAYAYAAGGLAASARSEIDRALEIAPKNEAVLELVKAAREIVDGLLSRAGGKKEAKPEPNLTSTPAQGLPAFMPPAPQIPSASPSQPSGPSQPGAQAPGAPRPSYPQMPAQPSTFPSGQRSHSPMPQPAVSPYAAQQRSQTPMPQPIVHSAPPAHYGQQQAYAQGMQPPQGAYPQPVHPHPQAGHPQSAYPQGVPPQAAYAAQGQQAQAAYHAQGQQAPQAYPPPQGAYAQAAPAQGYPAQGYPGQGYPPQGYAAQGYPAQGSVQGYPAQGYPAQGYPAQGHPGQGYPGQGYPGQGYPQPASHPPQPQPQAPAQQEQPMPQGSPAPTFGAPPPQRPSGVTPLAPAQPPAAPVARPSGAYSVVTEGRKK